MLLVISAIGADAPGIVSAVTGVLEDDGCNLEDTAMTILRGQFAMMLVVSAPSEVAAEQLEDRLTAAAHEAGHDLAIVVRPLPGGALPSAAPSDPWTLAVYGSDRPGIVHRVTATLASLGVNVVDLTTRLTSDDLYSMVLEITLPPGADEEAVRAALTADATVLGVEYALDRLDVDVL